MSETLPIWSAANLRKVAALTVTACLLLGLGLLFRDREPPPPDPIMPQAARSRASSPPVAAKPAEVVDHPVISAAGQPTARRDGTRRPGGGTIRGSRPPEN